MIQNVSAAELNKTLICYSKQKKAEDIRLKDLSQFLTNAVVPDIDNSLIPSYSF